MSNSEFDVIIVGAGPAGSVLAYQLATGGLKVLIIEKSFLPRYKTCGGGLTFKSLEYLPFDINPIIEIEALGGIFSYAGNYSHKIQTTKPIAWLVMRHRFDNYLSQQAVEAGAVLRDGLNVKNFENNDRFFAVETPIGKYTGRILVGADGVNSIIARKTGLLSTRKFGFGLEAELLVPPPALSEQGRYATFDFGAIPHGYGWIFPKRDQLSVGVFHAESGKAVGIRRYLDKLISIYSTLHDNTVLNLRGHPIPLGGGCDDLHKDRLLLVGDAANLADPWLGERINYAILSAQIAAQVILTAFDDESLDLSRYTTKVNKNIVNQFYYARIIADLVYRLPRLGVSLINRSEYLQESVFDTMRGDITFKKFIERLLKGVPNILYEVITV